MLRFLPLELSAILQMKAQYRQNWQLLVCQCGARNICQNAKPQNPKPQ